MTMVVDEGSIVVVEVMVHPLVIASSVVVLDIGFVIALVLVVVVLADSLLSSVVAGETVSLGQTGLAIVTWMIVMMVVVMGTVTKLTQETGMLGAVIVMPMIATPLVVITLVQTGMEVVQIVMHQVVMVGSEKEATRGMEFVAAAAVAAMIGVAQGVAWVAAMTGMVHVVVSLIVTAVEDLHAMMEEVTGRGLGLMIAPAGEDVLMIATDDRPSRLKLLMLQFRVPECLMYLSLALFCLILYFNRYWLMLPSLISLSGRLFLLVEIINLALSYYLMFQLFMECSCRELRFSVIAVIADLSIWYARMIFSEIAWHCWSE